MHASVPCAQTDKRHQSKGVALRRDRSERRQQWRLWSSRKARRALRSGMHWIFVRASLSSGWRPVALGRKKQLTSISASAPWDVTVAVSPRPPGKRNMRLASRQCPRSTRRLNLSATAPFISLQSAANLSTLCVWEIPLNPMLSPYFGTLAEPRFRIGVHQFRHFCFGHFHRYRPPLRLTPSL